MHTIVWNVVDSAVGLVPVTRVNPAQDALPASFSQRIKEAGSTLLSKLFYTEVYNPQAQKDLPVGVQIVCPAHEDEKLVEIMKIVDGAVVDARGRQFGPSAKFLDKSVY
jgi:amidase